MSKKTVDLSGYRDLDITSITMRSVNAEDTLAAAARCTPPDGASIVHPNLFNIMLRQQLLIESIVEVNGKPCNGPCLEAMTWSTRTREFLGEIFDYLNAIDDKERSDFQKGLAGKLSQSRPTSAS